LFPAHTRFMLPTHRYNGEISLFGALVFYGVRLKTSKTEIIAIPFQQIIRLYVRFDKGYHRRDTHLPLKGDILNVTSDPQCLYLLSHV
jgi:hypothetical protein